MSTESDNLGTKIPLGGGLGGALRVRVAIAAVVGSCAVFACQAAFTGRLPMWIPLLIVTAHAARQTARPKLPLRGNELSRTLEMHLPATWTNGANFLLGSVVVAGVLLWLMADDLTRIDFAYAWGQYSMMMIAEAMSWRSIGVAVGQYIRKRGGEPGVAMDPSQGA